MEERRITDFDLMIEKLKSGRFSMEQEMQLRHVIHKREDREREKMIAYELLGMLQRNVEYEWHSGKSMSPSQYGMDDSGSLGEALFQARTRAGFTQEQLSRISSIQQPIISRLERNLENPSVSTLKRLADGLGMSLNIEFV